MSFEEIIWNVWSFLLIILAAGSVITLIATPIVFWIRMLIDCINEDFHEKNDKLIWVIVIVFGSILGAILYYFCVKNKK